MSADLPARPVIDFHLHTFASDGALGPAELCRRARVKGYGVLGLADHMDAATLFHSLSTALMAAESLNGHMEGLLVLPGVELTHVPPRALADLVKKARDLGASHVVVHGETIMEPVAPGANLAAIEAGADVLAHPGLLAEREAALAAEKGVALELSTRGNHGLCNGHNWRLAHKYGAPVVIDSDAHQPDDLLTPEHQKRVALGAGLSEADFEAAMNRAAELAQKFAARVGRVGPPF